MRPTRRQTLAGLGLASGLLLAQRPVAAQLPGNRLARLLPDREKVRRADYHYANTGTYEDLFEWVGDVMTQLEAEAGARA